MLSVFHAHLPSVLPITEINEFQRTPSGFAVQGQKHLCLHWSNPSKFLIRILSGVEMTEIPRSLIRSNIGSSSALIFFILLSLWPHNISFEHQVISSAHASEIGCRHHPALLTLQLEAICLLARRIHGWLGDPQLLESCANISSSN